ncbi:hypothetical protein ALC152_05120 [Arcobacter sp. 15-2]|uniref:AAA family ATPase n=1 Tax=Arcobacter sp. 15-2 TaxID=3374109 RepID=UPI00399C678C
MSRNITKGEKKELTEFLVNKNIMSEKDVAKSTALFKLGIKNTVNLSVKKTKTLNDLEDELICTRYLPLRRNFMNNISADGGTGKTTLMIVEICYFLLQERDDYNRESNALFWASEDSADDINSMFYLICDELLGLDESDKEYIINHLTIIDVSSVIPAFLEGDKFNRKKTQAYSDFIELVKFYDLVAIDPLIAFFGACGLDENSNSDAKMFMMLLTVLCFKYKITIITISHTAKSSSGTRGASAFQDAFRFSIYISKYKLKQKDEDGKDIRDFKSGEYIYADNPDKAHLREVRIIKDNSNVSRYLKNNQMFFDFCYPNNFEIFDVQLFPRGRDFEEELQIKEKRFLSKIDLQKIENYENTGFSDF